jgi:F-type H+/Na+-transporting ATPase subunit alpha
MHRTYRGKEFNTLLEETEEIGFVQMISHPIVYISGLPTAKMNEVILFETGEIGWVLSLHDEQVEVLVLSSTPLKMGVRAVRTHSLLEIPVGDDFFGHSVNPLGRSIYKNVILNPKEMRSVESPSPGISEREKVSVPFETGVAIVDLTVPLGKGQRELVIGDRKTGKSEFLLQCMVSQVRQGSICIYACIGKKRIDVKKVEHFIQEQGLSENCIVVASSSSDSLGMIYLTPYSAMSMAEYFRDQGRDVLLILDDLTTHAKFYREVSLIGKKFPGRSSYPGDIFYTHSRLLERAGNFKKNGGGEVSITCLPVAETVEGDISGYIQTNIMSMTDGHVYFDTEIFETGRKPAVNNFLSVTRVGRQTQTVLRWGVNREIMSFMTLLEKTQDFVHFGAEINEGIKSTLAMGERVMTFFNQPMGKIMELNVQIILFSLIWVGLLNNYDMSSLRVFMDKTAYQYHKDQEFKNRVDDLINSSSDFNVLLGKIAPIGSDLVNYINEK